MVGHTGAPPKHERHEKLDMSRQQAELETGFSGMEKKRFIINHARLGKHFSVSIINNTIICSSSIC